MSYIAERGADTRGNFTPIVMVVLASTILGASLGILIADRDAFLGLKGRIAAQIAWNTSIPTAAAKSETPKNGSLNAMKSQAPPASGTLSTGLSSISAIQYSSQTDFTQLAFDLGDMDLIRTGKLKSPDRIYIDLQDTHPQKRARKGLKAQKRLIIDGDLLARVRIAHWESGAMRIVLDLKRSCNFTYQVSPGASSRLTVKIRPRATGASIS
jgi:hypothetical protein